MKLLLNHEKIQARRGGWKRGILLSYNALFRKLSVGLWKKWLIGNKNISFTKQRTNSINVKIKFCKTSLNHSFMPWGHLFMIYFNIDFPEFISTILILL